MASRNGFFVLVFAAAVAGNAPAQSVVSVRSGVLNYSEGAVFINNQPVKQRAGAYPALQQGSDLLTQSGRAELLLTPGAYLRIGQDTAVRMLSNRLTDTKVELLYGSAMLDAAEALENCGITLVYKDRQIKISKPGKYRIDSEPAQFRVYQGKAEIDGPGAPVAVLADQIAPLDGGPIVKRFTEGSDDLLDIWSDERHFLIASTLSNAAGFSDPANSDDTQVASADPGAWLGYVPPATITPAPIAPLAGIYSTYPSGLLGLGYGTYSSLGMYPMYIYASPYYAAPRSLHRSLIGSYPYTPIQLHTISPLSPAYGYRPVGSTITRPPGIGIAPRPGLRGPIGAGAIGGGAIGAGAIGGRGIGVHAAPHGGGLHR